LKIVDLVGGGDIGGNARGKAFEHGADLEQLDDFFRRAVGHDSAAVRHDRDIAFGIELPDGFTHGHAADAELLRQRFGFQTAAAGQGTRNDLVLQMDIGELLRRRGRVQHGDDLRQPIRARIPTLSTSTHVRPT